jgi:hypothetical protein
MTHPAKTPAPPPTRAFDSAFEEEESRVQARAARAEAVLPQAAPASRRSSPGFDTVTERTHRIEAKMDLARLVIAELSPLDGRGRLLASAILRRDEVLLDAVLGEMKEQVSRLASRPARGPR